MSIDYSLIWNKVMAAIREETDPTSFDIWFSMVKYHSRKNDNIYVIVPNTLTKDWIESRYLDCIKDKFRDLTSRDINL